MDQSTLLFWREFLRHPTQIGALVPTSEGLVQAMLQGAQVSQAQVIVEFGAGTGSFTKEIVKAKAPDSRFLAIELNPHLAQTLQSQLPQIDVCCESAANLPQLLQERNLKQVDTIISTLPWSAFDDQLQSQLLAPACKSLAPGGRFATVAYLSGLLLPDARRFARKLKECFRHVYRAPLIWNNLPPAFFYICTK